MSSWAHFNSHLSSESQKWICFAFLTLYFHLLFQFVKGCFLLPFKIEQMYCKIIFQVSYRLSSISLLREPTWILHSCRVGFHIGHYWTYFTFTKEHTHLYLLSMGRQQKFIINLEDVFGPFIRGVETTLPFSNPFRLSLHLAVFSFFFIVPFLYCRIFLFRKRQNTSIKGRN